MTSAARRTDLRSGFTLMELVMVLAIAAMVTAGAIGLMVFSSSERKLKHAAADVEVLAKRARSISQLQQKPYALEFLPGQVRL
ncbi:MAG TPA: prepilin-type N-terminal cleavage/methylation domain-containing protein, partial [Luteolibacter sp.]